MKICNSSFFMYKKVIFKNERWESGKIKKNKKGNKVYI